MTKIRIKFTKEAPIRFISHLDLARTIERALRRAQIPVNYSEGFTPRMKMAFGSALAVGVTSSGEYLDLELDRHVELDGFLEALNRVLPVGITFTEGVYIDQDTPTLMSIINRAQYILTGDLEHNADLGQAVQSLLDEKILSVERVRKKRTRTLNIRPWIFEIDILSKSAKTARLQLLVQTGSHGNVRPEEVAEYLPFLENSLQVHRQGLFIARNSSLSSPLEVAHC